MVHLTGLSSYKSWISGVLEEHIDELGRRALSRVSILQEIFTSSRSHLYLMLGCVTPNQRWVAHAQTIDLNFLLKLYMHSNNQR